MERDDIASHYIEKISEIDKDIIQAAGLSKQLLEFARKESLEKKTLDINQLVKNQARMFGRVRKEITIIENFLDKLLAVDAGQGQIEQVLLNIFINAAQAMPNGGDLAIRTESILLSEDETEPHNVQPGTYVKISITDTGIGMNEKIRIRIFEPFFTTKGKAGGTGLGLASTLSIIKNYQGFVTVYSEKNNGSTFNIYLPKSRKNPSYEQTPARIITKGEGTVLLVDDEEMVADVGAEMLAVLGYKVLTARSGEEALKIYQEQQNRIDLIMLDMIMPEMNGDEVFSRLRQINSHSKILLASGHNINRQVKKMMDRGCNGFLQKPFSIELLSKKINVILNS